MPVAVSLNTNASARKPTYGREEPASTRDPLRIDIAARRSPPNGMMLRLPAAVHVPLNSCHSPLDEAGCELCGAWLHPVRRPKNETPNNETRQSTRNKQWTRR